MPSPLTILLIAIGIALIIIDIILRRTSRASLPPLAVGLGIYLPSAVTLMVTVGSVVGWLYDKRAERTANPEGTRQLGVLLASGLMVGESLVGVLLAALVVFSGKATPLAVPAVAAPPVIVQLSEAETFARISAPGAGA